MTTLVETVTCDLCEQPLRNNAQTVRLGINNTVWELDLCAKDHARVSKQVADLTANGRRVPRNGARRTSSRRQASADWDYLESLGFKRHRGRKSAEEIAALQGRQ